MLLIGYILCLYFAGKFIDKAFKIAGELPESIGRDIIIEIIDEQFERKF